MKDSILKILALSATCLMIFSGVSLAQENDENDRRAISAASSIYVISAKAGGVNFTEGKVAVARKDGKSGLLIKGDNLEVGDKVSTAADGKAEILLNPGSFVRLGENSDFEFVTTSLDDLKLRIGRGSAMFEVFADRDFRVAVAAPKGDFYLVKSGVYRIDVAADGTGRIEVWKGNAQIGDGKSTILKSGQAAVFDGTEATIAKFDRDEKDTLEQWSKTRSKALAKINAALDRRTLRSSLLSTYRSWNIYDSFGLWVYSPYSRSFCFLPFGYGWRSPYGYWLNYDIWSVPLPQVIFYPVRTGNGTGTGTGNTTTGNGTIRTRRDDPTDGTSRSKIETTYVRPPFTKVQTDVGSGFPSSPVRTRPDDSFPSSFPSSQPSVPMAIPAPSTSAPVRSGKGVQ